MNDHTKEESSTCGNFTTNVPTTPMLVVRDGEKLAEKLSAYNNDNEDEFINRVIKTKVRNYLYDCSNDNVAIIDDSLSENDSYNLEIKSRENQKSCANIVAFDCNVTYSKETVDKNKSIKPLKFQKLKLRSHPVTLMSLWVSFEIAQEQKNILCQV